MRPSDLKIWIQLLVTITLALAVVWAGGILWQNRVNRDMAIAQARSFSLSMHDATMAGLTGMMVTGTIAQRAVFLDQVRQLNNIRDVRVLRGDAVKQTFGPGNGTDVPDAEERQVLASGEEIVQVESDAQGEYLRAVRPALARKAYLGKDCTSCHQVPENSVLGVVSMKLSLAESNAAMARQRAMAVLMAVLTGIPVLLIIHPFIRKVVTRPLEQGVQIASDIAAGDLTHSIAVGSRNEIGRLQQALKDMRDSLVTVVGRVRAGTETIAAASGQIATGNLDLSSRTASQAQALRETAGSMAQLTDAARQNADSARQANQLAISASQVAVRGGAVVSQVVATMDAINASSAKIADIVSVIDSLAFQTNILALNAAVEASRAGEHGRGFAVVATEVRMLARRSAGAAAEIKTLIGASVDQTDSGSRLVHQAGTTMTEIVRSIQRVTDIMGEISAASANQITGIEQVNAAMGQMDGATRLNAQLVDEAAAATQSLQDQAAQLARVVGVFKLAPADQAG
jgi:methyl-accepting chemotaxis protein